MTGGRVFKTAALACLALSGILAGGGCGEKIAIPQAVGLFSINAYLQEDRFDDPGVRQLVMAQGALFVVTADALTKRNQNYGANGSVTGLADPRALCKDTGDSIVFVWEQGNRRVSWYSVRDLAPLGSSDLPEVRSATAMVTNERGIEQVPGAFSFLYLADPDSGVVHRYAFDEFAGLLPHGILARADGDAARFIHEPAGLASDGEGMLLACDADTLRNWIIRFDGTPDLEDVTPDPLDQDPLRGLAVILDAPTCEPPAAADFVIGDAAICDQVDWVGGPSAEKGEFHAPRAVAVDGTGRIFVSDTGNNRIQIFDALGEYQFEYGTEAKTPVPTSLSVVDVKTGSGSTDFNWGAYIFVVLADDEQVLKLISYEHYQDENRGNPPPPE